MIRTESDAGWQLRGNAAEAYQAFLVPAIFQPLARRLVEIAGVEPGEAVLDVATGTGVVARAAASRCGSDGSVAGVDLNPEMLAVARATGSPGPEIEWTRADAATLPFEDGRFDVALCQEAIQFFPDRVAVLREMRRVTRPGGRIAFSALRSLDRQPVYAAFVAALREHAGEEAARMMESPFGLGDPEALRALARRAGLGPIAIRIAVNEERFPSVEEFVRREAASSPLAGPLSELGAERTAALVDGIRPAFDAHRDDEGLAFANETHVVVAGR